ncbi:hypothetical protein BS47DRAFT_1363175 [Hydnum rufescens UP504]|uniref:Uncharacterized protein n=1 Tax=Hydnum rufescens UP504 TaxID=1448309 RepID=A0A9P6AVC3_9AGAM|nr:hypothetical protein BS47DRAFT_1363175 [Hydnum rufescens UP504]
MSRLTMPRSSSRPKARSPIWGIFPTSTSPPSASGAPLSVGSSSSSHGITRAMLVNPPRHLFCARPCLSLPSTPVSIAVKIIRRPRTVRSYGYGTELDAIPELVVEKQKERLFRVKPKTTSSTVVAASVPSEEKWPSSSNSTTTGMIGRRTPGMLSPPCLPPHLPPRIRRGKTPSSASVRNPAFDSLATFVFEILVAIYVLYWIHNLPRNWRPCHTPSYTLGCLGTRSWILTRK